MDFDGIEECDETFINSVDTIRPYQFEPLVRTVGNNPESDEIDISSDVDSDASHEEELHLSEQELLHQGFRRDNLAWCDCSNCTQMDTEEECLCCHEVGPVAEKLEDQDLTCITDHEGFQGNCLNRFVIETTMYDYVEREGPIDDNEPINELYRYIAYRRFTRWTWHHLGKGRRKVIPSCAVQKIREAFPSEQYAGFKYPRPYNKYENIKYM